MGAADKFPSVEAALDASSSMLTVPDIRRETGLDEPTVRAQLKALAQQGQIDHIPGRGRYDGRYGLLRPIARPAVKESLTVQEATCADGEGGETDARGAPDSIVEAEWTDVTPRAAQEAEATRDMLSDARLQLDMIREALGVPVEPHQSLFERMVEEARLAAAHRDDCMTWERSMMTAVGEDCVGSVMEAIGKLRADIANAAALNTKLEHLLGVERQACAALREQLDADGGAVAVQDAACGYLVKAPKRKPRIVTKPETAVGLAKAAARNGSGRGEVYALVYVGSAKRDAVYREAK